MIGGEAEIALDMTGGSEGRLAINLAVNAEPYLCGQMAVFSSSRDDQDSHCVATALDPAQFLAMRKREARQVLRPS